MTKWAAESLARRYGEVHGLDLGITRLASPFGPFERDTGSRPLLSAIQQWASAGLRGETITLRGPASLPRDVAHVADIASGIAAVLLAEGLPHVHYNVGWGRSATAEETLAALARVIPGLRVQREPEQPSPWLSTSNAMRGPLSIDRLKTDLGWSPRYDLDSGLAAYVDWLRENL
jgi:UDP-glucose 4-epimerase